MKKLSITIVVCLLAVCSYSQEHVKFNGATFGKPTKSFVKSFPKRPTYHHQMIQSESNAGLYNLDECYWVSFNSNEWFCKLFSSIKTRLVFRTICVANYSDLKNGLMLLVKALEEKYGGGIQEKQEELGKIVEINGRSHQEMLALYYYVKNKKGKTIGEIRISAAPIDRNAISGWIELSHTDYKTRDKATKEYNSMMRDAL